MIYVSIIFFILFIDILSKYIINLNLNLFEMREILNNKLYLKHIKNEGIAYSILSKKYNFIMSFSIIILFVLIIYFIKILKLNKNFLEKLSLSFVIGGALGNFIERLKFRKVTDFIYVRCKYMPIFNIADIFIFLGNIFYLFFSLRKNNFK